MPMDEKNWSRFKVVLIKEMQDHRAINLYLFILPRNEGLQQKMQTTNLNLTDSLQEEDKKRTITLRLVFCISFTTDSAMCNGKLQSFTI